MITTNKKQKKEWLVGFSILAIFLTLFLGFFFLGEHQNYYDGIIEKINERTKVSSQRPSINGKQVESLTVVDSESLILKDKEGNYYGLKNAKYSYYKTCSNPDFIKVIDGDSCFSLKSDDIISQDEAVQFYTKFLPKENILKHKEGDIISDDQTIDLMVNYRGVYLDVGDIVEKSYYIIDKKHKDFRLYQFFLESENQKREFFLIQAPSGQYHLLKIVENVDDYITTHNAVLPSIIEDIKSQKSIFKNKKDDIIAKTYSYIVKNYEYREDLLEPGADIYTGMNGIISMANRSGVCGGYASSMVYILNHFGIKARKITGLACGNDNCLNHAWVEVPYTIIKDGKKVTIFRYFDPTFEQGVVGKNKLFNLKKKTHLYWKLKKKDMQIDHYEGVLIEDGTVSNPEVSKKYLMKTANNIVKYMKKNKTLLEKNIKKRKINTIVDQVYFAHKFGYDEVIESINNKLPNILNK